MMIQSFKMACSAILSNKMRSFLTMLGIIIGVTSLVVLVSLVNGAVASVNEDISSAGNSKMTVTINNNKGKPLTLDEVLAMGQESEIKEIAPVGEESGTAKSDKTSGDVSITGTTPGYFKIQKLNLASGRILKKADVDSSSYTAVINHYMAQQLFGTENVTGRTVIIAGRQYKIAGVLQKNKDNGWNMDRMEAYVPYSTLMRSSETVKYVNSFVVLADNEKAMKAVESKITDKLLERFQNDTKAFRVDNEMEFLKMMESTNRTMVMMLGGIAGISLIVGGIGIMNIMLVSVTERTREIGIRKAIGADYANIMVQFLVEAVVISLMGCLIGILLSWGIVSAVDQVMSRYHFKLSPNVIWLSVAFSATIGVAFGSYPANKAAKKKPIEALRFS
ncbi:ABC transporter permease [Clostridium sp. D5]|uniref:ABC transporter permease n=1 Tax=Clostridium sp. D5 TaxID=556261 RepID=UPI0001FC7D3A|nr:ABC transporter permease [Clostridium sp. D5]EGB92251.1 macrolide export ATP-binding/permease protein MacB [Clostridium sp. D5]